MNQNGKREWKTYSFNLGFFFINEIIESFLLSLKSFHHRNTKLFTQIWLLPQKKKNDYQLRWKWSISRCVCVFVCVWMWKEWKSLLTIHAQIQTMALFSYYFDVCRNAIRIYFTFVYSLSIRLFEMELHCYVPKIYFESGFHFYFIFSLSHTFEQFFFPPLLWILLNRI